MRIEEYWEDATEFYVRFETESNQIINKTLILFGEVTEADVIKIIFSSFRKVKKIIYIEEIYDTLVYKNNQYKRYKQVI